MKNNPEILKKYLRKHIQDPQKAARAFRRAEFVIGKGLDYSEAWPAPASEVNAELAARAISLAFGEPVEGVILVSRQEHLPKMDWLPAARRERVFEGMLDWAAVSLKERLDHFCNPIRVKKSWNRKPCCDSCQFVDGGVRDALGRSYPTSGQIADPPAVFNRGYALVWYLVLLVLDADEEAKRFEPLLDLMAKAAVIGESKEHRGIWFVQVA